ncbi:MAG: NAD(P)H-binding protein [Gemella haemolysans]|uniref:NAD(P)H-binding protein n=1 Tax=Gemella haemolysans TaxID=1379 RepID=UPI00291171B0|nr:NAD(P)H-binding protein [Gemella haemolysans]MDU4713529.1 NAD(P)H-binding protein [Gemella haemolysans]
MEKTAVIIGATGAVGREISNEILSGEYYDRIYILGRSSINKLPDDSRLTKIIIDFENINFDTSILEDADVFASLGTTIKIAGSKENQRKIDVDYTVNFAKLCEGKVRSFNVVSAIGANSKSKNFYNSLKGELEDKLKVMNLGVLRIFQPSLLISKRNDKRFLEELFMKVSPILQFLLKGKTKKYSPIEVSVLGREIVRFAIENKEQGTYTYKDF